MGVVLTLLLPTSAFGNLLPTDQSYKGSLGGEVVEQSDGSTIEYYKDQYRNVYYDLPK